MVLRGDRVRFDRDIRKDCFRRTRVDAALFEVRDHLGDDLFRFPTAGAIADGDDGNRMLAYELLEFALGVGDFILGRMRVNHAVFDDVAGRAEDGDLAAGAHAGVDGEHRFAAEGRAEQQALQIAGEDFDAVLLGELGHLPADFAFEARQHQAVEGVFDDGEQKLAVRVVGQRQVPQSDVLSTRTVPVELGLDDLFVFAPVHRQDAMRRHHAHRLFELEVVAILRAFALGNTIDFTGDDHGGVAEEQTERPADIGEFGDDLGEDVPDAGDHVVDGVQFLVRVHDPRQDFFEVVDGGIARPNGDG